MQIHIAQCTTCLQNSANNTKLLTFGFQNVKYAILDVVSRERTGSQQYTLTLILLMWCHVEAMVSWGNDFEGYFGLGDLCKMAFIKRVAYLNL